MGLEENWWPREFRSSLHQATGILRYAESPLKVFVEVDPQLSDYYRALVPKWITTQRQLYPAHISVVRNETPAHGSPWGCRAGEEIAFVYENIVRAGQVYIWLNVFSTELELVRRQLGLPVSSPYTLPPDGFGKCFHMTLGNFKA